MRSSLYYKTVLALQTDSIDFTKTNKVSSNVKQTESSKKSKLIKLVTSASFTDNTPIHSSGTD